MSGTLSEAAEVAGRAAEAAAEEPLEQTVRLDPRGHVAAAVEGPGGER